MRYLLLILLASVTMAACGDSEAPDCTSGAVATALHAYLLDAEEYSSPADPKLQQFLAASNLSVSNFRTTSQDNGLHAARCVAHVTFKKDQAEVSQELPFADHLPGDKRHIIDANLDQLRGTILAAQ